MSAISDPRSDFTAGEHGEVSGFRYRIVEGQKKPGDLVLEIFNGERWVKVSMELGGFLADFHYQVEDHLYPRTSGHKGGEKYFEHMRRAVKNGWRFASAILTSERTLSHIEAPTIFDWEREGIFE